MAGALPAVRKLTTLLGILGNRRGGAKKGGIGRKGEKRKGKGYRKGQRMRDKKGVVRKDKEGKGEKREGRG